MRDFKCAKLIVGQKCWVYPSMYNTLILWTNGFIVDAYQQSDMFICASCLGQGAIYRKILEWI